MTVPSLEKGGRWGVRWKWGVEGTGGECGGCGREVSGRGGEGNWLDKSLYADMCCVYTIIVVIAWTLMITSIHDKAVETAISMV